MRYFFDEHGLLIVLLGFMFIMFLGLGVMLTIEGYSTKQHELNMLQSCLDSGYVGYQDGLCLSGYIKRVEPR